MSMDLSNLDGLDSLDYKGQMIYIDGEEFMLGEILGMGTEKITYEVINPRTGTSETVLQVVQPVTNPYIKDVNIVEAINPMDKTQKIEYEHLDTISVGDIDYMVLTPYYVQPREGKHNIFLFALGDPDGENVQAKIVNDHKVQKTIFKLFLDNSDDAREFRLFNRITIRCQYRDSKIVYPLNDEDFDFIDDYIDIIALVDNNGYVRNFEPRGTFQWNKNKYFALYEDGNIIVFKMESKEDDEEFLSYLDEDESALAIAEFQRQWNEPKLNEEN